MISKMKQLDKLLSEIDRLDMDLEPLESVPHIKRFLPAIKRAKELQIKLRKEIEDISARYKLKTSVALSDGTFIERPPQNLFELFYELGHKDNLVDPYLD